MFRNDDSTMQLTMGPTHNDGVAYCEVWIRGVGVK
jgi:hypothetical protein